MENKRLRIERKKMGATQAEMAKKLGLSLRTYQNYEYGATRVPKSVIKLLGFITR